MGRIYFIRHGESEWNVADKICGATDVPLTEKGHEQAIQTGQKFLEMGYTADVILCSPLMRAADTARHISEITGIPVRVEPRLVEQNFGIWEGTSPRNSRGFFEAKQCFLKAHNGIVRYVESWHRDMTNEEFAAYKIGNGEIRIYD